MASQLFSNWIALFSLVVSLLTLWLAFKISDRFGVASTFKAKEQQLVTDFVGNLFGFKLGVLLDNGSMSSAFSSDAVELFMRNLILKERQAWQVYLSKDLYEKFVSLGALTNHPYFPPEIRDKCSILTQGYQVIILNQKEPKSLMFFSGEIHFEWDEVLYFQPGYEGPFNTENFLNQLRDVLLAVEAHYKKNLPNHIPERIVYRYWNQS